MDCGLNKKTVFITGGSTGIGKATARLYGAEPGVRIAVTYFSNKKGALDTVARIKESGAEAMAVHMDLSDKAVIKEAVEKVRETFGDIDVLIANAIQWPAERYLFEEGPAESWKSFFETNLLGTVKLCQTVVPEMKVRNWGRIVFLSSDLAIHSMKGSGRYSSMKAALSGLAANLVVEFSPYNILTNIVMPSWTLTDRAKSHFPVSFREAAVKSFPTGRITSPEDAASIILYLGSGANGHVNGEHIRVTGGCSLPLMTHLWDQAKSKAGHKNETSH